MGICIVRSFVTRIEDIEGVATHCNTHCNTLQHIASLVAHCNTLQHTATHCNTLQPNTLPFLLTMQYKRRVLKIQGRSRCAKCMLDKGRPQARRLRTNRWVFHRSLFILHRSLFIYSEFFLISDQRRHVGIGGRCQIWVYIWSLFKSMYPQPIFAHHTSLSAWLINAVWILWADAWILRKDPWLDRWHEYICEHLSLFLIQIVTCHRTNCQFLGLWQAPYVQSIS